MKKINGLLLILVMLLGLCTGCARPEGDSSEGAPEEKSEAAPASSLSEAESWEGTISLQGDLESGTLEVVWTQNGESRTCSTPTLNGFGYEELTMPEVEPFSGIMGYSGFCEIHPRAGSSWSERYYYAMDTGEDESPVCIAESYGYEQNDYSVDLDGDGVTELICNCSYASAGTEDVFVYREEDGCIWKSSVDKTQMLSGDGIPTDAVLLTSHGMSYYDGGQGIFFFSYPDENWDWLDQEVLWPEEFTEAAYEPSYLLLVEE